MSTVTTFAVVPLQARASSTARVKTPFLFSSSSNAYSPGAAA
jgi:hypothetical protein